MRLNVMLEPQEGMSYAQILAVARRAEQLGFEGLYRSDHYSTVGSGQGLDSTDAWATLAGIAVETERLVLGTMVSPVTFRRAGNLAKVAATVAEMAGSLPGSEGTPRVHLGLGTGWLESEHRQHGFPFEDLSTRFRRLEEHLEVVTGLWDPQRDPFTYDGEFVSVAEALFRPMPDPRPRLIVGGKGKVKTPRLAARFADELNTAFPTPADARDLRAALDDGCEQSGRDPGSITLSVMTGCLVGATDEELRTRARRLQASSGNESPIDDYLAQLAPAWVVGTPEQAVTRLGELADAGVERVMLQHQLYDDLDMLDVVANEVGPRL